jgi:hypothetical protein
MDKGGSVCFFGEVGAEGVEIFFLSLCYIPNVCQHWFSSSSQNVLQDVPTSRTLLSHILWPKIELFIYISQRTKGGISSASIGGSA